MLTVVERFFTLSGEAPFPGKPVYLVRFAGCNLDCSYCDTPHRNEINETLTDDQIISVLSDARKEWPHASVLLTGGEPLLDTRIESIQKIIKQLPDTEFFIETNGSILIPENFPSNARIVADWKTESSGCANSFVPENLSRLRAGRDCIKIVMSRSDMNEVLLAISVIKFNNPDLDIYLSPQSGAIEYDELADWIVTNRLPATLSLQLHKIIWGNRRGV